MFHQEARSAHFRWEKSFSLFIENLDKTTSISKIRSVFQGCGWVCDVCMMSKAKNSLLPSYVFVRYNEVAYAHRAIAFLDGECLLGKRIVVRKAIKLKWVIPLPVDNSHDRCSTVCLNDSNALKEDDFISLIPSETERLDSLHSKERVPLSPIVLFEREFYMWEKGCVATITKQNSDEDGKKGLLKIYSSIGLESFVGNGYEALQLSTFPLTEERSKAIYAEDFEDSSRMDDSIRIDIDIDEGMKLKEFNPQVGGDDVLPSDFMAATIRNRDVSLFEEEEDVLMPELYATQCLEDIFNSQRKKRKRKFKVIKQLFSPFHKSGLFRKRKGKRKFVPRVQDSNHEQHVMKDCISVSFES